MPQTHSFDSSRWQQDESNANIWVNYTTGFRILHPPNGLILIMAPGSDGRPVNSRHLQNGRIICEFYCGEIDERWLNVAQAFADGYAASSEDLAEEIERIIPNLRRRHTPEMQTYRRRRERDAELLEHMGLPVPGYVNEFRQPLADGRERRGVLKVLRQENGRVTLPERTLDHVEVVIVAYTEDDIDFSLWELSVEEYQAISNLVPAGANTPARYSCRLDRIRQEGRLWPAISLDAPLTQPEA